VSADSKSVVVLPVGGANFASLAHAFRRLGVDVAFSDDPLRIAEASHVVLPGVGAARPAMAALRERGLDRTLMQLNQPLLGICLGMQLLFEHSEEGGGTPTLGLLPGRVERLPPSPTWPHMGWNTIAPTAPRVALLDGISGNDWFYFVHGYAAPVDSYTTASCEFGRSFSASVSSGNVHGVQFHPEKSSVAGRAVLANFLAS
jgi:glutamine amidotransferase